MTVTPSVVSVSELGATVTYNVLIENGSNKERSLGTFSVTPAPATNTCATGTVLAASTGTYSCSFTRYVAGSIGTDTTTVSASGPGTSGGGTLDATASPTVAITSAMTLTVTPSASSVNEPGGSITYSVAVQNTAGKSVTQTALSVSGTTTSNTCTNGSINNGATYTCSFTKSIVAEPSVFGTTVSATISDGTRTTSRTTSAPVTIADVRPSPSVSVSAAPSSVPEPGGTFTYAITVSNLSSEANTLTALSDGTGSLAGTGTCAVGGTIAANGTYTCSYTRAVTGQPSARVTTVTATLADNDTNTASANGSATVTISDVLPSITVGVTRTPTSVPETGGIVTYAVTITNTTAEANQITALSDTTGSLSGLGTCATNATLAAAGTYSCSYTRTVSANANTTVDNTVTATVRDDENNTATASATATVSLTDVRPAITVTIDRNVATIAESGGAVTYTVTVVNGTAEANVLTSLADAFGSLDGRGTCATGATLGGNGTYVCAYSRTVSGNAGTSLANTVNVTAHDDENNTTTATATASVTFNDVVPAIDVRLTPDITVVPETGDAVTYTVVITNTTAEDNTLVALADGLGSLAGFGTCATGVTVPATATFSCAFTRTVAGEPGTTFLNTVSATVRDDENNTVSATATSSVVTTDVLPSISVTLTADKALVPETGGAVTVTVTVTNNTPETNTIESLDDGATLNGRGTCTTGSVLAGYATYTCVYSTTIITDPSQWTTSLTATARDNENNTATAADTVTVTVTDVLPGVDVSVTSDITTVPETGAMVTYSVVVTNTTLEVARIFALFDTNGSLDGVGTCATNVVIGGLGTYRCTFARMVDGEPGVFINTVTAAIADNESNLALGWSDATITRTDALPALAVSVATDVASVPETGSAVAYTVTLTNGTGEAVTIVALNDRVGSLDGVGTCSTGVTLAGNGTYTCAVTRTLTGEPSTWVNTIDATVRDNELNNASAAASASVALADVLPAITVSAATNVASVPETGAPVTTEVTITNTSTENVVLDALGDSAGSLSAVGTCSLAVTIAPSDAYRCSYERVVAGEPATVTNTVTAVVRDNDGNSASADARASVVVTDVLPAVSVGIVADRRDVLETGEPVTATVTITNQTAEPVTLTAFSFGTPASPGTCTSGIQVAANNSASCTFVQQVSGDAGETALVAVTVTGADNDGNSTTASSSAPVLLTDVLPAASITVTPTSTIVAEPGGPVSYTIALRNTSSEAVTLASLADADGSLAGTGSCATGGSIGPDATYTCVVTKEHQGTAGDRHTLVVTASVADDDGNVATATDSTSVLLSDLPPVGELSMRADTTEVPETGGTVRFTIAVNVTGREPALLESLMLGGISVTDGCPAVTEIEPGSTYRCTVTRTIGGTPGRLDVVAAAVLIDDEGNRVGLSSTVAVIIFDVTPEGSVTPTASVQQVPENEQADVLFTAQIKNSSTEPNVLAELRFDSETLDGQGTCRTGISIEPGATYSCSFSRRVTAEPGKLSFQVQAVLRDARGNTSSVTGTMVIAVSDVAPQAILTATASPNRLWRTGGNVTFDIELTNVGAEVIEVRSLTDDQGDVLGASDCRIGSQVAPGETLRCSYKRRVTGDIGWQTVPLVATVGDNDNGDAVAVRTTVRLLVTELAPPEPPTTTLPDAGTPGADETGSEPEQSDEPAADAPAPNVEQTSAPIPEQRGSGGVDLTLPALLGGVLLALAFRPLRRIRR